VLTLIQLTPGAMKRISTPVSRASSAAALVALVLLLAPIGRAEAASGGIHDIKHVVMIMQENRSFDSYFGTYPGANGIPADVCVPDPLHGGCVRPYHDAGGVDTGGPHGTESAVNDIDGGRMDGFVAQAERGLDCTSTDPSCGACGGTGEAGEAQGSCLDVMGYHDAREIPNYWTYAHDFVLQDDMFESAASWSLPEHLYMVSAWSAVCPHEDTNPFDCVGSLEAVHPGVGWEGPIVPGKANYAWTDVTYLLHKANVSWRYYVLAGDEPDCEVDEAVTCEAVTQSAQTPGIWNPLADFTDVAQDNQLGDIQPLGDFYKAVHRTSECGLPAVTWIDPNSAVSEHPPASIAAGQAYVTTLINTIMRSPCWNSSVIFLSWDDWGGFYDHVQPPTIDEGGYGLRVPGLVISPYAKAGYVDHQQLSHDAYLKFIEDDFLASARLNPKTDGRPDNRPDVREEAPGLGNLVNDFNFSQRPREPLPLSPEPPPGPPSTPPAGPPNPPGIVTAPVSQVTTASAQLGATIDTYEAPVSACRFEYGRTNAYGTSLPCTPMPSAGELPVAVSAVLEKLTAGTTYYYRVLASGPGGTGYGTPQSFTTARAAGLPEVGRCTKAPTRTGGYEGKGGCTTKSPSGTGAYEWQPGVGPELESRASAGTLGPPGQWQVGCAKGALLEGDMTGTRTLRMTLTLKGCANATLESACQSTGAREGEIKSGQLEGEVGFIASGASPSVGVDLRPEALSYPDLLAYECGGPETGFEVSETGSVIGRIDPLDTMSDKLMLTFAAGERQVPEMLEGEPPDTPVAVIHPDAGGVVERPSAWSVAGAGTLREAIEVKAID
jgi:phospholipase C